MTTTVSAVQGDGDRARSDLNRLARGSALNVAGSSVAAALNFVLPVVITRSLTPDQAGVFFQATAVFAILFNVGTLGADTGVLRALPQALVLRRPADLRRYLVVAVVPAFAFAIATTGVLILLAGPLSRVVMSDPATADDFRTVLLVLSPWIPVAVVYTVVLSASRGLDTVRPLVFVEKISRNAMETGCAAAAAVATTSVALIVTAWVAPYAAVLVVITVLVARRLHRVWNRHREAAPPATSWRELTSEFWRFSAPRWVSRIFTIALQRFDILVVGALRGPAEAAIYAAATRFLILGLMFVQAIQQVMSPKISETFALGELGRAGTIYRTTTSWLTLVSWPIYLTAGIYASLLLGIFGPDYRQGATAAMILCAAMLVATACGPVDSMLLMAGRSVLSLINTGVALAINVGLDLLIVPRLGVTGAALGWAVSILVKNLLALWQVNRGIHMHPLGPGTRASMAVCLMSYGAVVGAIRLTLGSSVVSLVVAATLGTAVFAVLARRRAQLLELPVLVAVLRRRQRR